MIFIKNAVFNGWHCVCRILYLCMKELYPLHQGYELCWHLNPIWTLRQYAEHESFQFVWLGRATSKLGSHTWSQPQTNGVELMPLSMFKLIGLDCVDTINVQHIIPKIIYIGLQKTALICYVR